LTSKAEHESDSEDENEVYSKILKEELIESLKELVTHFEHRTNELSDLKEKYVALMKQQESTLLDLKTSEEGLRGFDFICKTYEDKLKILCQKLLEKCDGKPLSKHEIALEVFIIAFKITMVKRLDSQKGNLMGLVLKHVVNALRKD